MHVLIISHMFPNKYNPNYGIFVQKQVEELTKRGLKVTVLAPTPIVFPLLKYFSAKWKKYSLIPKEEKIGDIRVIHSRFLAIPGGFLKQYWGYINYFLFKNKIIKLNKSEKFDIIHAQGSAPDDYAAYLLSQKLKTPYIQTLHGDAVLNLAKKGKRFSRSKIAIEKANAVITVSSKIKNKVYELTERKDNIVKILNGYVPFKLETSTFDIKVKNNLNILFAGNLIPQKGCDLLIEAFSKIQKEHCFIKLHIAGDGVEAQRLKMQSAKEGLEDKILFYGNLEHNKLLSLMSQCDIFIMPSRDEAFGIVYLEAMSLHKPTIGTEGEGIADLIQDGINGLLVQPNNVDSIIEKLKILIENKELRDEIAEKGYKSIKNLTWEFNATETVSVYESVLNKYRKF